MQLHIKSEQKVIWKYFLFILWERKQVKIVGMEEQWLYWEQLSKELIPKIKRRRIKGNRLQGAIEKCLMSQ